VPPNDSWEILDAVPDAIVITDREGRVRFVNARAPEQLGHARGEIEGQLLIDLIHPNEQAEARAKLARLAAGEEDSVCFETRTRRGDGSYRWIAWNTAARDDVGISVARDITARIEVEASLRAASAEARGAHRFLDTIVENLPNMVFVKDAETLAFARINRAGEALLGVPRDALIGKTDYDFFPAEAAQAFQAKDRETLREKALVDISEEPIQTATGQRWLHTKKVPVLDEDGTPRYLLGISEDITDSRQASELRARLASIVEGSNDAIIGSSLDGVVLSWNGAAEEIFGYAAAEIVGQHALMLMPSNRGSERRGIIEALKSGQRIEHFETVRLHKNGSCVDVSVTISPIRDEAGEIVGLSSISRDIGELKRGREALVRARDAAEAASKELESFSYSVAHDLRAPLRSIDGFSLALLEDYDDKLDASGKRYLGFVREAAQRMAFLIDDLLALSRVTRSELVPEPVDLSALARLTVARLQKAEPARRVHVTIEDGLRVEGDSRLLGVLLDNLLGNAWKFTRKREGARIELGATSRDGQTVHHVRDNGAGFDMAYASKLFGVFQRLHRMSEFEGTGVGLATVLRIIKRHGGRVWAEGRVDEGATFFFTVNEKERGS
jgi:PAS domain S-box-containing protein